MYEEQSAELMSWCKAKGLDPVDSITLMGITISYLVCTSKLEGKARIKFVEEFIDCLRESTEIDTATAGPGTIQTIQ